MISSETNKTKNKVNSACSSSKILRFRKSERLVHWALAIPFLVCFGTALVLVFYYNPDPLRPYRALFSWTHRVSGICLIILPMLAIIRSRGDFRIYFYNIKQAWVWSIDDLKWLSLMGLAAVSKKIKLPEQGKFNAAEKLNFMKLMSTYPLYILTGLIIWMTNAAFLSWAVHFFMAIIATPLVTGHLYMAMINPESRKGLNGMFSGVVDRQWAKHHYGKWYREHFENSETFAVNYGPQLRERSPRSDINQEQFAQKGAPTISRFDRKEGASPIPH
ncbi:MAG: cytochrome b/b6 domain-containing protein [Nitrospirota bacterium]